LNQQRQPITETRYPIDQTIPHQLVVSKILGALMCHPAFRIIQHEGQRPFVTPTDALADLRGACDIAVSLDGSMKYGLVIEVKTTAHSEGGAWKIFKAVREERRNALQFERLVNAAPRWWYLIVRTDKLTAKTHEEHDRNLLDCPAILVDGKQGDQVPEDFIGPLRFGEMLQFLGDRLHISSSTPIKTPSREQLAFPIDDVPVVTMDTPLDVQPVWTATLGASLRETDRACEWSIDAVYSAIRREWDSIGDEEMTRRFSCETKLLDAYVRFRDEPASRNHLFTPCLIAAIRASGMHNVIYLCMALLATREGNKLSRARLMALFPEAVYAVGSSRALRHLLPIIARQIAEQ